MTKPTVEPVQHKCPTMNSAPGGAIEGAEVEHDGRAFCGNSEYITEIVFCPFCGEKVGKRMTAPPARDGPYREIDARIALLNATAGVAKKALADLPDVVDDGVQTFIVELPEEFELVLQAREVLGRLELACLHRAFEEAHRAFWGKTTEEICTEADLPKRGEA